MPIHDWTRVNPGIFHHFHLEWIGDLSRVLNRGLLPSAYYALAEQIAGGFGPDVLTLQRPDDQSAVEPSGGSPWPRLLRKSEYGSEPKRTSTLPRHGLS